MERSLHRVSLGSRRAQPGLSFYLTTFGKCAARGGLALPAGPERAVPSGIGEAGSTCLPWSSTRGSGHRLRPSKPVDTTCCLSVGVKGSCCWLFWLE